MVSIKTTTGITEFSYQKIIKEIHYYYTLSQEIQKQSETTKGLIIEYILFNDNSTKTIKIFYN
jgi:hypothetical protein